MNGRNRIGAAMIVGGAMLATSGAAFAQAGCFLPGRPDPDAPGEFMLRGFIVAWAVNNDDEEISWNHLAGTATVVNYQDRYAWEYNAGAFQAINPNTGDVTDPSTPGRLNMDGVEYAPPYGWLLLNFQTVESTGFSNMGGDLVRQIESTTDLTLMPLELDVQQESEGPVTTKVVFDVWNENEVKFSGAERCLTCWDEFTLDDFSAPHFMREYLQTDHGKARLNGVASQNCPGSTSEAIWGVAAKMLLLDGQEMMAAGESLFGMGTEPASIIYDSVGGSPPTAAGDWPGIGDDLMADPLGGKTPGGLWSSPFATEDAQQMDSPLGPAVVADRMSGTEKGSLLVFPKVEVRWNASGEVIQDTFIQITNDNNQGLLVHMYFVNGDEPLVGGVDGLCDEPGWNWVNNQIPVTANQPLYWSAYSGMPTGVSPWFVLDP